MIYCCYCQEDLELVAPIAERIERSSNQKCQPGEQSVQAIDAADLVLFFHTERSGKSEQALELLQYAILHRKPIICVLTDRAELSRKMIEMLGTAPVYNWRNAELRTQLLYALRSASQSAASPTVSIAAENRLTGEGTIEINQRPVETGRVTYAPERKSLLSRLKSGIFGGSSGDEVNTSVFAPQEVQRGDHMIVQLFLYKDGDEDAVVRKAAMVDPSASQQNYTPLSVAINKGDLVSARLSIQGNGVEIDEPELKMTWMGKHTDCQFSVFVPDDYSAQSLIGTISLTVSGVPCARMVFRTRIALRPAKLYSSVESKKYQKIFISYAHQDEDKVKFLAQAYKAQGVNYFFDRHYLKGGDVFPHIIKEYLESADLFILCWSENAATSEYVQLERTIALSRAFPQRSMEEASLQIYPVSIAPRAAYPEDMKNLYNFDVI